MFLGSLNGRRPTPNFAEEEATQLIAGRPAEQIGEPTEYIDEVEQAVDERLLDVSDGLSLQWDFETTGHVWQRELRTRASR